MASRCGALFKRVCVASCLARRCASFFIPLPALSRLRRSRPRLAVRVARGRVGTGACTLGAGGEVGCVVRQPSGVGWLWPVHGALHSCGCFGAVRVCVAAGRAGWAGGRAFCVNRELPPGSQHARLRLGAFRPPFLYILYCMLLSNLPRTVCATATVLRLHPPCGALAHTGTLNSPPPPNVPLVVANLPGLTTGRGALRCTCRQTARAWRLLLKQPSRTPN